MSILESFGSLLPRIKDPVAPLAEGERALWTIGIMFISLILIFVPAFGIYDSGTTNIFSQIFGGHAVGSVAGAGIISLTVSIGILLFLNGSRFLNLDLADRTQKLRYESLKRGIAVVVLIIVSAFTATFYTDPYFNSYLVILLQFIIGGIAVIYLDEVEQKYGIVGSGLIIFFGLGSAYTILSFLFGVSLPISLSAISAGGQASISNILQSIAPIVVTLIAIYFVIKLYQEKIAGIFSSLLVKDESWNSPLTRILVLTLPTFLASRLIIELRVFGLLLWSKSSSLFLLFLAQYQFSSSGTFISGGLFYLLSSIFPSPYASPYGIGGYSTYLSYLLYDSSQLITPFGQSLYVPEYLHVLLYIITLVLLTLLFVWTLLKLLKVDDAKIKSRLTQIHGNDVHTRSTAIELVKGKFALIALLIGFSLLLGAFMKDGIIFGGLSLYVIYLALIERKNSNSYK